MASVVQNMIDGVLKDGARSTKFECEINFAGANIFGAEKDITVLAKTTQFPGKTHEIIPLVYKGRTIPIKGQTKYENTWSCTFYLSEDHGLKKAFEDWIEAIDQVHNIKSIDDNKVKSAQSHFAASGYTTTLNVAQMDFHGDKQTAVYELHNAFPISVSAVDADYSEVGTILEFTVEFSFAYFNSKNVAGGAGNFVDEYINGANDYIKDSIAAAKDGLTALVRNESGKAQNAISNLIGGKNSSKDTSLSLTAKDMGDRIE